MGASTHTGAAEAPSTPSALTTVVVHSSGAVCTRTARVALPRPEGGDGTATVRVTGLPPALRAHSLRARVTGGAAGVRVTDVRLDLAATLHRGDELPHLRLDLEDAQDRVSRLADRVHRLEQEIDAIASLRAEPPQPRRGDPPRWAPVESLLALAGFVDTRLATLHTRLRGTEDELAEATHAADVLADRLATASTATPTERTTPTVSALLTLAFAAGAPEDPAEQGAPAGELPPPDAQDDALDLEVEYQVPGAAWAPVYQLRLDGRTGDGSLVLRACVAQRTGEDWTGVRLGLSTADLMRRTDLPELRSLRIGRRQEQPPQLGWREPPPGLGELFAGYDAAAASRADRAPHAVRSGRSVAGPALMAPAQAAAAEIAYGAADDAGYGGAPGPMRPGGPPPAPMAPGAAEPPRARMRHAARGSRPQAFAAGQDAFGGGPVAASAPAPAPGSVPQAAPAAPVPPAALAPSADLLDYAGLTMTGPDAPYGRGTLRPAAPQGDAVMAEYRRRAVTVDHLPRPAHGVDVRASAGSFDYRFDTTAPVDVEADGAWHTVPVGEVPVRTESGFVCVPSQDTAVFGTVLLTNISPHALLAGPADVLVDGDFVLTAPLPTLAPGQRQAVGLGVAESVQVVRATRMRESTAGLRGGTTVLDHTVEIEVANRLPYAVTVEIRERVPVSSDKDVRIEEHKAQPPWTAPDQPPPGQEGVYVRGLRVWRVELEPGRTTTLTGGYDLRLPAGKSVVGGNRRN